MSREPSLPHVEAIAWLKKYPNYPLRTLARLMSKAEPLLFPDLEYARSILRYCVGQMGETSRLYAEDRGVAREPGSQSDTFMRIPGVGTTLAADTQAVNGLSR